MNELEEMEKRVLKKLEIKFNEAGIHGYWAINAARRVVKLYKEGMDFQKAVYKVYREL